mmetsp:Transcript_54236/g.172149  ORF Transcript_54236/g.172149 Transcript_54236/m.172149 type:complete len:366 (-) Transcript_54236:619-1716(-)
MPRRSLHSTATPCSLRHPAARQPPPSALGEEEAHVVLRQAPQRLGGAPHRTLEDELLLLLQLDDPLLDGALDDEAGRAHGLVLPQAVNAVLRLLLHRGVPPRVHEHHPRGGHQVERHPPRLEAHQEHHHRVVLREALDDLAARVEAHAPVEAHAHHPALLEAELHDLQHAGELREDDGLGGGVLLPHPRELLPQRLDLGGGLEGAHVDARHDALALEALGGRGGGRGGRAREVHAQGLLASGTGGARGARGGGRVAHRAPHQLREAAPAHPRAAALRLERVLGGVVADRAQPQRPLLLRLLRPAPVHLRVAEGVPRGVLPRPRRRREGLAAGGGGGVHDEVGVVHGLAEADEEVEDVRVVVQDRP